MKHPSNHCTLHAILLLHPPSLKIKGEIAELPLRIVIKYFSESIQLELTDKFKGQSSMNVFSVASEGFLTNICML